MGKVLETFSNGFPGTPSRTADEVIITMQNGSEDPIACGEPVFIKSNGSCEAFDRDYPQEFSQFLGFAVRVPDKTPDSAVTGQNQDNPLAVWRPYETMEVLVRGAITVPMVTTAGRGSQVYLRKSDGRLVTSPGTANSTVELANVRIRNEKDAASGCAEVIVNKRNII